MPVRVRIDPIEQTTTATILAESFVERQKVAAQFARDGIEEAKRVNESVLGRVPPYTVTVDGRVGASLDTVNPDGGQVVAEFELVSNALREIYDMLIARSPRRSGDYMAGHRLFADGRQVTPGAEPPADEYVFANLVPYARKLEVGKTKSGRAFLIQVPNRIYERTAKDARARLGNQADITFAYRTITGSSISSTPAIVVRYKRA